MLPFKNSRALIIFAIIISSVAAVALFSRLRSSNILARDASPTSSRMSDFPKVFLWAWERPEHLEFINPREVGVAFLAETIYLREERVIERPRLQPLKVPQGTTLIAVVRIESGPDTRPSLSEQQRSEIVEALARIVQKPNIAALQIDFDATQSERKFYRELLNDVRRRIPESMALSITALASWCIFDNWLDGLPVDEAVPMIFQMGIDQHRISNYLQTGGDFRAPLCQQSVGISTDEFIAPLSLARRTYIFNAQPWTELTVRHVLERSRK